MKSDSQKDETPEANGHPDQKADPRSNTSESDGSASFWSESQVQEVIRHAGTTGRSPEEFFSKKWKKKLIHGEDSVPKEPGDEA